MYIHLRMSVYIIRIYVFLQQKHSLIFHARYDLQNNHTSIYF